MKKILFFITILLFIFYIVYIKFYFPYEFISYENYHWISYLNFIHSSSINSFNDIVFKILNILTTEQGAEHWFMPRLLYWYLINAFPNIDINIFIIQWFISIVSYLFFSLFLYYLFKKDIIIFIISFLVFICFPHQIKYWLSEDYYILWNFFISVSLFTYYLLLITSKKILSILLLVISLFTFILSIYTRNLYLIYLPFFFLLFIYSIDYKKITEKDNIIKTFLLFIWFISSIYFIIDRVKVLINANDIHGREYGIVFDNLFVLNWLIPIYYLLFFIFWISLLFFFRLKVKILILIFTTYYLYVVLKYIWTWHALERHFLLLEPLFLLISSIGIYFIYKLINKYSQKYILNYIIIIIFSLVLLLQPYVFRNEIKELYSMQEEFLFIQNNIDKIWDNFNLIITSDKDPVNYDFPFFLLKNINYNLYSIDWKWRNYKFSSFIDNNDILDKNNIFYLSSFCYTIWFDRNVSVDQDYIRDECKFMLNNYEIEVITEKYIIAKTYIIPEISSDLWSIKIGFYRILWLKEWKK